MTRALRWLRARMGVRAVSALAAAASVAVVLVVAGISLVLLLNNQLRGGIADAGSQQAEVLGQRVMGNFSSSTDVKKNALDATGKRIDLVQVVTDYGTDEDSTPDEIRTSRADVQVIGSSDTLDKQPPMVDVLLPPGEEQTVESTRVTLADGTSEEVLVVAKGFRATGRPITVLAAQPLLPVHQAVDTVEPMVVVGVPVLALIAGFFTYLFSGRALRPVEAMRRRVAGLTDRDLAQRVPEPPAQDEVGRLARTMNRMLSRLEDAQAAQRRFVADASHELRSPLATVSTGLELLAAGTKPQSADHSTVRTLRGETTRLTTLVENLLFLARADERGLVPRCEEVDLDEIVESERVRPTADDRVAVTVVTEPVRVTGDRGQLVRVVRNLVDNARRHAETAVAVTVRPDGDAAVIDVEDDGPGVPEADRSRVFERFVRLDEARARGDGGSGLGLAIVAELVAAHGGSVAADTSSRLGGALFRVRVPLADPAGVVQDLADGSAAGGPVVVRDEEGELVTQTSPVREPMGGRRRSDPVGSPPAPAGDVTEPAVSPARPVPAQSRPGRAPVTPHPVPGRYVDPPTGPLPIRPNTVGSPADQNATRPLPIVTTPTAVAEQPSDRGSQDERRRPGASGGPGGSAIR